MASSLSLDLNTKFSSILLEIFDVILFAVCLSRSDELWVYDEVLSFGFNLAVSYPSDSRGSKARIVLLPSRITRWFFYHIA